MKKVSVIVPVYNTKKELRKCLSSIQEQTYKDLEVICIDDGSTDGSEEIVDLFAREDNRFKVIHQQNAGESYARNVGLKMMTGDVFTFCDCDDWIDQQMYETQMREMSQHDLDMVAVSWYKETEENTEKITNALPVTKEMFDQKQLLKYLYMRDSYRGLAYMWNKMYKRKVLQDSNGACVMFDETLSLGGDVVFLARMALNVNRVKYIDQPFYHYNQRTISGCHTKDVKKLRDWIKAYEIIIKLFSEKKVEKETLDYVKRFLAYHSCNAAEIAIDQGQIEAKREFQLLMGMYEKEYIELNERYPDRISRFRQILRE